MSEAFDQLTQSVHVALETYSNVHRGSGHHSVATTHLYERAREIVLGFLGLDPRSYTVIFCSPRRAELLSRRLKPDGCQVLSSQDLGLPLGVRAVAVRRSALPGGAPFQSGGGTARLVFPDRVIWAGAPDRFEAGTPAIVNIIAFARALQLVQRNGKNAFHEAAAGKCTARDVLYQDEFVGLTGRALLEAIRPVLIGCGSQVPTVEGLRRFINLDNAASTPTFEPILMAAVETWRQPEPVQLEIIQEVQSICAAALGTNLPACDLIFTTNTTEAINLVAENLGKGAEPGSVPVVMNTLLEHNSNELPWRQVPGASLVRLPVDKEGFIDLKEMETQLRAYNVEHRHGNRRIELVSVSGASNVLGTYNDLAEISQIVHRYGARLLVDAAQMVAHRRVEMDAWGIDYLAFSAHKVYAPFGCGVLLVRKGLLRFSPAEMAAVRSSGEENVGGIAALGKALILLQRIGMDVIQAEEQALTHRALTQMAGIPGIKVHGVSDPNSLRVARRGGVIAFSLDKMMSDRIAKELAARGGIGIRYGCHCAHLLVKYLLDVSPGLARFQGVMLTLLRKIALPGVSRVSLGIENREEDVDRFIHVLDQIARQPRERLNQGSMDEFSLEVAGRVFG
jgi:selenocysteine lyase/cysteine desulfurase